MKTYADFLKIAVDNIKKEVYKKVNIAFKDKFPKRTREEIANIFLKKCYKDANKELDSGIKPHTSLEDYLLDKCNTYIFSMRLRSCDLEILNNIKSRMQKNPILLVVGAGFSAGAGIPLGEHLDSILQNMGLKTFEELIKQSRQMEFKTKFAKSIEEKPEVFKVTQAHRKVANNFSNGKIVEIVCLNWDNLIEDQWKKRNVRKISRHDQIPTSNDNKYFLHYLWKFHGDVEDLDYDWVFPGMEDRIFPQFTNYMKKLEENPSIVMLIVGYSELGEKGEIGTGKLCREVISPLERVLTTYRIGMDLELFNKYNNYLFAPAEAFIPKLFS
jgi:hypothetical protein